MKTRFTLLELLVVIAVIMLLASMLLPALQKAKSRVQSITCMNILSNLGKASSMYEGDYGGWTPAGNNEAVNAGGANLKWTNQIRIYLVAGDDYYYPLWLICPKAYCSLKAPSATTPPLYRLSRSYGKNLDGYPAHNADVYRSLKICNIPNPSRKLQYVDCGTWDIFYIHSNPVDYFINSDESAWTAGLQEVCYRHNFRANIVNHDGHTESLKGNELYGPGKQTDRWIQNK